MSLKFKELSFKELKRSCDLSKLEWETTEDFSPVEEVIGQDPTFFLTEESKNVWRERIQALKEGKFVSSTVEYEVIKKDGTTVWALMTSEFKEDSTGQIVGAHVVGIDITEKT